MAEKSVESTKVALILASIFLCALCGTVAGLLTAWLGTQSGIRVGIYVGIGLLVFGLVLKVWRIWLERKGQIFPDRAIPNLSPPGHGPRNHIICLDGTWNLPGAPTNVRKLFERLVQDPQKQIARYYPGVGTREFTGSRTEFVKEYFSKTFFGGATAYGSSGALSILRQAYFDFVQHYQSGDRIYIFGFSRGAATARALANYICKIHGLPESVEIKYLKNRLQKDFVLDLAVKEAPQRNMPHVVFLGLWDTVASIGNPYNKKEPFDLNIPPGVEKVVHLVAIDEIRKVFNVVLIDQNDRVEEVWFPGAHSNVGGGLKDCTLSDIALHFMVSRVEKELSFQKDLSEITHDLKSASNKIFWKPARWWRFKITRKVWVQPEGVPRIHQSVFTLKEAGIEYNPQNIPEHYELVN